ncbi:MAG: DUF2059 domain-containing protein [Pseudomonadota bacterium]|nr:DUF2059 domain-containing protein [Pseudomonadota bacterium]
MKRLTIAALLAGAALMNAQAQTKKELVQKLLTLQQAGIEQISRGLVERPALQLMQEAGLVLQRQVAPDKREALGKQIEAEVKKYVDESVPLVRDRAIKLAPTTIGPILEEKFSDEELKQLIAWFDSPVNKKYQQLGPEMQNAFVQKLVVDARPVVDPKIQALDARVRTLLGVPPAVPNGSASAAPTSTRTPSASNPKAPAK